MGRARGGGGRGIGRQQRGHVRPDAPATGVIQKYMADIAIGIERQIDLTQPGSGATQHVGGQVEVKVGAVLAGHDKMHRQEHRGGPAKRSREHAIFRRVAWRQQDIEPDCAGMPGLDRAQQRCVARTRPWPAPLGQQAAIINGDDQDARIDAVGFHAHDQIVDRVVQPFGAGHGNRGGHRCGRNQQHQPPFDPQPGAARQPDHRGWAIWKLCSGDRLSITRWPTSRIEAICQ